MAYLSEGCGDGIFVRETAVMAYLSEGCRDRIFVRRLR